MALTRQQKEELLGSYERTLREVPHVFLLGFRGITVPQVTALRGKVRESGGQYLVVKNALALKAIQGTALADLGDHFRGPTAVALSRSEPVALAKVLSEFAKQAPLLEFKAGLVEGRPVGGEDIRQLAELPGRQELLARLVFLLESPIRGLVGMLGALPRQLVVALDQVRLKKEQG